MKIAITGGAGFIGGRLDALLNHKGHETVILDTRHDPSVDVTDRDAVMKALAGVDIVYHLAAEHRDDVQPVQKYYDVNVGGAENIVAAAEELGIDRIIFTSTVAVYGLNAGESREDSAPEPFNDYGKSKLESELVFRNWAEKDQARSLGVIRLVATFGPGNRGNIHTLMDQICRGRFIMVGNGENRKSIAYVGNVVDFLHHLSGLGPGAHLYNYADKPDLSMNQLVRLVRENIGLRGTGPKLPYTLGLAGGMALDAAARITGRRFPVSAVRVRKFCADTVVGADKLEETGFTPAYTLDEGLKVMLEAEFKKPEEPEAA